jgi:hypothetical protein
VRNAQPLNAECGVCEVSRRSDSQRSAHWALQRWKLARETVFKPAEFNLEHCGFVFK